MEFFLKGFGVQGYKSFGSLQYLAPLSKINLFVGQNNSGKSNVLRFVRALGEVSKAKAQGGRIASRIEDNRLNRHQGETNYQLVFALPVGLSDSDIAALCNEILPHNSHTYARERYLKKLLLEVRSEQNGGRWWFQYSISDGSLLRPKPDDFLDKRSSKYLSENEWRDLWSAITAAGGGNIKDHWIPNVLERLCPLRKFNIPDVFQIDEQRKIGLPGSAQNGHSGEGLIGRLAELQNPTHDKQNLKKDFERINTFVKEVTENSTARIEIPADRSTINVEIDNRLLPIESLGSGIHQVIILGAAATTISNSIVCIEEPEVHLHPQLQRKLLNYLNKQTSNQYFITTHSAHLLDAAGTSVFHVRLQGGQSLVRLADSPATRFSICHDLGYRASDIMQSPCVIWVEGPSDRIYIRHWIRQTDPLLEEDIHYSVMFYGGRLLSHLSADDQDVTDFISLRRLNRNLVVVIDSDRDKRTSRINKTKQRVVREFEGHDGFAWITEGREIENYIDPSELEAAMRVTVPKFAKHVGVDQFDKCLSFYKNSGEQINDAVDKVKLAKGVCKGPVRADRFDLQKQLIRLTAYIRGANHMEAR